MTPTTPSAQESMPAEPGRPSWIHRLSGLLFVLLTLELGLFLLIYPWMDAWGRNYLVLWRPDWRDFLLGTAFRGAISGLGILNLLIAFNEILRALVSAFRGRDY